MLEPLRALFAGTGTLLLTSWPMCVRGRDKRVDMLAMIALGATVLEPFSSSEVVLAGVRVTVCGICWVETCTTATRLGRLLPGLTTVGVATGVARTRFTGVLLLSDDVLVMT